MSTTVANRSIKARAKATPSRIQSNIRNSKAIKDQTIIANDMVHVAETENLSLLDLPVGDISVPLNLWLDYQAQLLARGGLVAVQLAADEDPEHLLDDLAQIPMIVLPFVTHVDGRGYSHAYLLRKRYHYQGEIRAIGDVGFDQLGFLSRVGCNAFELNPSANLDDALRAFTQLSQVYQASSDAGTSIFKRRRKLH